MNMMVIWTILCFRRGQIAVNNNPNINLEANAENHWQLDFYTSVLNKDFVISNKKENKNQNNNNS